MKRLIGISMLALFLSGCFSETSKPAIPSPTNEKEQISAANIPAGLFTEISDEGALSVKDVRVKQAGEKVKLKAKVIGRSELFVEGRAMFVVGDPDVLKSCDLKEGDGCKEPWDVCCMDEKDIVANTMSIQVVDAEGKALKTGLKGKSNLDNLSNVIIEGVLATNSTAEATILNAEKITVLKSNIKK